MLDLIVDKQACRKCGACPKDCLVGIISMSDGYPAISPDDEGKCYKCQHCFAVCPSGAISIHGLKAENSQLLADNLPTANQVEVLIKGRRSVRRYKEENLEADVIQQLLDVANHAPSGMNCRQVLFTVVDDRAKLNRLREEMMTLIRQKASDGSLPQGQAYLTGLVKLWEEEQNDVLFRGAPHLVVTSAPKSTACPVQDCMIALSTFDLYAQSLGVGTLWDGIATGAIGDALPEIRARLGIPEDHIIGYAMAFGLPAVQYARTTQHSPAQVHVYQG